METERILLRHWKETDAETLFKYASDPDVGPRAGWQAHKSVGDSMNVIRTCFNNDTTWAIVLKKTGEAIGCMSYYTRATSNIPIGENDCEVGYWLGKPFWNRGICTEALMLMLDYCIHVKHFENIWADHFTGNPASGKVLEKCGFTDTGKLNRCSHLAGGNKDMVKVFKYNKQKMNMEFQKIYSAAGMMELIRKIGFLPLLNSGITGFSAEDMVDEDCKYVTFPEGGWDWPLWKWKGEIVTEMPCMYGKFFNKKAGFISREWWPDFCNYRRSKHPRPTDDSIEGAILYTLQSSGSLTTRELRAACGFGSNRYMKKEQRKACFDNALQEKQPTVKGLRGKFDSYLTQLEMATYIVTEDFIYPRDRHNREYGWGWSLLNTPEELYGKDACQCERTPEESCQRIFEHLKGILPDASDKQIRKMIE